MDRPDAGASGRPGHRAHLLPFALPPIHASRAPPSRRDAGKPLVNAPDDHAPVMPKVRRGRLAADAALRNREQLARLGGEVRRSRGRWRLTQAQLAGRVGLSRPTISAIERGLGGSHTLDTWQRLALALGRPLRVELARDPDEGPADAGHLALQELVLRLGRRAGWSGSFELPTKPAEPWRSTDVGLVGHGGRCLLLVECWNTMGDLGAAVRSSNRKLAEAQELAATGLLGLASRGRLGAVAPRGQGRIEGRVETGVEPGETRVAGCWVIRATARNRRLLATYPELFSTRFPGSSRGWLAALVDGGEPPELPGIVWASVDSTRLFAHRRADVPPAPDE